MNAFWQSFLILFLAEMGDKTQIVSFAFGAQYPLVTVLLGVFLAVAGLMALSVGVGNLLGSYIPEFWMSIISGLLFIAFGIWTMRGQPEEESEEGTEGHEGREEKSKEGKGKEGNGAKGKEGRGAKEGKEGKGKGAKSTKLRPLMAVMFTFFMAELGDKTIFASVVMAGKYHDYLMVWLGSTLGMMAADVPAMICGRVLGKQLPEKVLRYGSATVLIGAGIYTIADAAYRHGHS